MLLIGNATNGWTKSWFFLPALHRRNQQSCFKKKTLSCNTHTKHNAILFAQHTLAVVRAFHTAFKLVINARVSDIVFLQTTLLISCTVRVKIIKISSSHWWRFELATSAIKSPLVHNSTPHFYVVTARDADKIHLLAQPVYCFTYMDIYA